MPRERKQEAKRRKLVLRRARKLFGLPAANQSTLARCVRAARSDAPRSLQRFALIEWFVVRSRQSVPASISYRGSQEYAQRQEQLHPAARDEFLQSYEWRRLRMEVLRERGARCECCGATPADGKTVINVDHIKPRLRYPELALDKTNLQVLCDVCNHGKGNWDETDWRDAQTAKLETPVVVAAAPIVNYDQVLFDRLIETAPVCPLCHQITSVAKWRPFGPREIRLFWWCCDARVGTEHIAPQWADRLNAGRKPATVFLAIPRLVKSTTPRIN